MKSSKTAYTNLVEKYNPGIIRGGGNSSDIASGNLIPQQTPSRSDNESTNREWGSRLE